MGGAMSDEIVEKAARAMAHALIGMDLWDVISGTGHCLGLRKTEFMVMAHAAIAVALEAQLADWSARPAVTGAHATSDLSHVTCHNNSMAAEPLTETAETDLISEGRK
jgi:hypothetical protein